MHLAVDCSNIADFAYFVGGRIVRTNDGSLPSVLLADNKTVAYAGYYAVEMGNSVSVLPPEEVENTFTPAEKKTETLPEGWSAYSEGFDYSVFGYPAGVMAKEDISRLEGIIAGSKEIPFGKRRKIVEKLNADPAFLALSDGIKGAGSAPLYLCYAYDLIVDRFAVPDSDDSPAVLIDSAENGGNAIIFRGFTAPAIEVQKYQNRIDLRG